MSCYDNNEKTASNDPIVEEKMDLSVLYMLLSILDHLESMSHKRAMMNSIYNVV